MSVYTIKNNIPGVWEIDDGLNSSLYIIEGTERALVIDTGMSKDDIVEMITSVTKKPYDLALTHGHGDHSMHASKFHRVYLDMADKDMLYKGKFPGQAEPDEARLFPMDENTVFSLGEAEICVVPLHGHTPGSVLFVDKAHKCVFTGDAVGSGCGVWMQVPNTLPLSEYAACIRGALDALKKMGVDDTWNFLGGHASQRYLSTVSDDNPVCIALMEDMAALCDGLLSGEIPMDELTADNPASRFGQAFFAKYGRAEMIFRKEQLR